jgi:hypothetical protein
VLCSDHCRLPVMTAAIRIGPISIPLKA